MARIKPPIKRKIMGLAKAAKAASAFTTPVMTANVGPKRDVTGIGTGSVIHHSATSTIIDSSLCASNVRASIGVIKISNAKSGAPKSPTVLLFLSKDCSALLMARASCPSLRMGTTSSHIS